MSSLTLKMLKERNACLDGIHTFSQLKKQMGIRNPTIDQMFIAAMAPDSGIFEPHIEWAICKFSSEISRSAVEQISWNYGNINGKHSNIMRTLLRKRPCMIKHINIKKIKPDVWVQLLYENPQFIKYRGVRNFASGYQAWLLSRNPNLIKHINVDKLTASDWYFVLKEQPSLAKHCNVFTNFNENHVYCLLYRHGKLLAKHFTTNQLSKADLSELRRKYPKIPFKNENK